MPCTVFEPTMDKEADTFVLCWRRALLALCLLVAGAHADDAAAKAEMEKGQSVYLPTTTNDYSGMIYSLLQEQAGHLAGMEGADVRSSLAPSQSCISLEPCLGALIIPCSAAHAVGVQAPCISPGWYTVLLWCLAFLTCPFALLCQHFSASSSCGSLASRVQPYQSVTCAQYCQCR